MIYPEAINNWLLEFALVRQHGSTQFIPPSTFAKTGVVSNFVNSVSLRAVSYTQ